MGLENLNRIHWAIIGAIVGMALAFAWANTASDVEGIESASPYEFERDVAQKEPGTQKPLVKDIVIHPREYSPVDGTDVNLVTYERLFKNPKDSSYWWVPKRIIAAIPYKPQLRARVSDATDLTIEKYLTEVATTNDFVKFRDGWWLIPKNAVMIGGAAGVILIGGIWPTLLGLMTGAGFGPKRQPKEVKGRSLWSYKSTTPETKSKAMPTAADHAEVQAIADAYERNLGHDVTESGPAAPVEEEKAEEVRKLQQANLEDVPKIKRPGEDDEIEVKGEFYPIFIHHQKEKETDKDHEKDKKPES